MNVVGYARVSTEEQGQQGAGMEAQIRAIETACVQRGWTLDHMYGDVASGSTMEREGLKSALIAMKQGRSEALVVAKLDRLSRSLLDFAGLAERARKEGWAIVALDLGLDMTTPAGALVANVMAAVAEWERQTISARTKAALAVKKANGVHIGRRPQIDPDVRDRILRWFSSGATPTQIAAALTRDEVPTPRGGKVWRESTIRKVLA